MNPRNIVHGIYGGIAGGLVFGAMMINMFPMIGQMVGQPSAIAGFLVHMLNSAIIGAAFAVFFGNRVCGLPSGVRWGLAYGGLWWFLGPLTLMPLFLGMGLGASWNLAAVSAKIGGLFGHLLYGAALGAGYAWLSARRGACTHVPSEAGAQ